MAYFPGSNCLIECAVIGILRGIDGYRFAGISSSKSSMYTLNSIGEMTEPCRTPAGHGADDDNI